MWGTTYGSRAPALAAPPLIQPKCCSPKLIGVCVWSKFFGAQVLKEIPRWTALCFSILVIPQVSISSRWNDANQA